MARVVQVALVVDDSMLIRHTVCRFLESRGFLVESATNGREALDMMSGTGLQPDVIFTDLVMPQMTGGELIQQLKANPQTAPIPIILLVTKRGPEPPVESKDAVFVIYKDIAIQEQLEKALEAADSQRGKR